MLGIPDFGIPYLFAGWAGADGAGVAEDAGTGVVVVLAGVGATGAVAVPGAAGVVADVEGLAGAGTGLRSSCCTDEPRSSMTFRLVYIRARIMLKTKKMMAA